MDYLYVFLMHWYWYYVCELCRVDFTVPISMPLCAGTGPVLVHSGMIAGVACELCWLRDGLDRGWWRHHEREKWHWIHPCSVDTSPTLGFMKSHCVALCDVILYYCGVVCVLGFVCLCDITSWLLSVVASGPENSRTSAERKRLSDIFTLSNHTMSSILDVIWLDSVFIPLRRLLLGTFGPLPLFFWTLPSKVFGRQGLRCYGDIPINYCWMSQC